MDAAGDLKAGQAWHRVVEDDEVGPQVERLADRLDPVGGFTDDQKIGLGLQHRSDTLTDGAMVVDNENSGGHGPSVGYRAVAAIGPQTDKSTTRLSGLETYV